MNMCPECGELYDPNNSCDCWELGRRYDCKSSRERKRN